MSDKDFIQQFSDISVRNICIDLHLLKDYCNIMSGRASKHKLKKVRKELERRLEIIYENTVYPAPFPEPTEEVWSPIFLLVLF